MRRTEPLDLLYDGRCGFCVRALAVARACDVFRVLRFHDAADRAAVEAAFPMVRGADLDDAMYAVSAGGRVSRGFFAFRRVVRSCVLLWPLLPLFYFPGSGTLGPRVYAWIARTRGSLGCHPAEPGEAAQPGGRRAGCSGESPRRRNT